MTRSHIRRMAGASVGAAAIAVALFLASAGGGSAAASSPAAQVAVETVASEALYQLYAIGTPSAQQTGRRTGSYVAAPPKFENPSLPAALPDAGELNARTARAAAVLAEFFTDASPALTQRLKLAAKNTDAASREPGLRIIGSGVSALEVLDTSVDGSAATVRIRATVWSAFQHQDPDGTWSLAVPTQTEIFTATEARNAAGVWRISDLVGVAEDPPTP